MRLTFRTVCFAITIMLGSPLAAQAQPASFFKGRTITLSIGFGSGGANDAWSRAIARHLGRHLAGAPLVVVQNMPGAGGLTLLNQIYNLAPRDGTALGLIGRGIPFEPLLGGAGTSFDPLKLTWIGSPERDIVVCAARKDAAVQTLADLATRELVMGATGSGADTAIYPEFLGSLLGFKFKTVKGYKGTNEILLALERNEVQGLCASHDSLMRTTVAREGKLEVLFQASQKPDPRLKDIPVPMDVARSEEDRQALDLFFARDAIGRPYVAPPQLPAERTAELRAAFKATMADTAFVDEVAALGLTVDQVPGEEIAAIMAKAFSAPAAVIKRTAAAMGREVK